jgi:NADH-quinone oxidoreductase subunit C
MVSCSCKRRLGVRVGCFLASEQMTLVREALCGYEVVEERGYFVCRVSPDVLIAAVRSLKEKVAVHSLMSVCCVDRPAAEKRFDVIYNLLSLTNNVRVMLYVGVDDGEVLPCLASEFPSATWYEREMYDMYGLSFSNDASMRRILMDESFRGYPLRKDFPLTGYVEVRYDPEKQSVVDVPVDLEQDYRTFDFETPWKGPRS